MTNNVIQEDYLRTYIACCMGSDVSISKYHQTIQLRLLSHFQMTSWVSTEILQRKTSSLRAVVIEHFIQIANYCYKHNDLHCALNITIALGSSCIKSLKQTWSEVDKKVIGKNNNN